ncbi:MAG: MFS transporter [Anaerolineales bacterium]
MKKWTSSPGFKVALIALPIFIGALDLTVVSAVLPHLLIDLKIPFQTGMDNAAWIITGYLLAYSVSMTFMGRLSDIHGRRKVYLAALVIFAFGSYLAAVAHTWPTRLILRAYYLVASGRPDLSFLSLNVLIGSRMIQAFGAGTMVPVGMAMVGDLYPIGKRARPLGVIAAVDTAGWVVGHLYGGIIVRFWSWQTIFWLNLPICLIAWFLIRFLLEEGKPAEERGKMDWIGAGLIAVSLSVLNIALGSGSENTSGGLEGLAGLPPFVWPLLSLALVFLIAFIWWQKRVKDPLIELSLFKEKNYLPASLTNFLIGVALFIAIANVPLFINTLIASTPEQGAWESGWMLSGLTVPMALAAVPGGWISDRKGYRLPSLLGLIMAVVGFVLMTSWRSDVTYLTMGIHLSFTGIGLGLTMAPIAAAVINASPAEHRGTSSALVIIFRLVGMTVGVSSITTFGLRRSQYWSTKLMPANADMAEIGRVGIEMAERVISETFLVAMVIAALALIPALFLRGGAENN